MNSHLRNQSASNTGCLRTALAFTAILGLLVAGAIPATLPDSRPVLLVLILLALIGGISAARLRIGFTDTTINMPRLFSMGLLLSSLVALGGLFLNSIQAQALIGPLVIGTYMWSNWHLIKSDFSKYRWLSNKESKPRRIDLDRHIETKWMDRTGRHITRFGLFDQPPDDMANFAARSTISSSPQELDLRQSRVLLDQSRKPGNFARRHTERVRREWFEAGLVGYEEIDEDRRAGLWNEYRRQEAGTQAEETVGRFLDLLRGWKDAKVFHSVKFQGQGLPTGDVDHLVVFEELFFAFAIETKYRLNEHEMPSRISKITEHADLIQNLKGWYTWPVLCEAAVGVRDNERQIGRYFTANGTVLVTDAIHISSAITWILTEYEDFGLGNWTFPERRNLGILCSECRTNNQVARTRLGMEPIICAGCGHELQFRTA